MGTEAVRRVYGIGGSKPRYFVTMPSSWLRAIEKKHRKALVTMSFRGFDDRAILRPLWGEVVAERGSMDFVSVLDFKTHKKIQLPLSWLVHIGFNPHVHGKRKPQPRPFRILVQTTDDNELILLKLKGEPTAVYE